MIKINLATRKQSVASSDGGKSASGGGGLSGFLSGFKSDQRLDGIKELPIRKFVVGILACLAVGYASDAYKEDAMGKVDAELKVVQDEQSRLKADLAKTKGYDEIKKHLEEDELILTTKINTIQKLLAERQDPPKMMAALSNAIPAEAWLDNLKIGEKEITFKGKATGIELVSDFVKSLNESAYFTDTQLGPLSQERDSPLVDFELQSKRR